MYALYWESMMYCEPLKAVTGKRPARSENRASSRYFDEGCIVARSLIDGRSASGYMDRNSCRNSSSGDVAAEDENADRAEPLSGGLDFKTSSAVWCVRVDRTPEREAWIWPRA